MTSKPTEPERSRALLSLFRPGSGTMPPLLAGREDALNELDELLGNVLGDDNERRSPPSDAVLYGPRGNGKTALLNALEDRAIRQGIDVVSLSAAQVESVRALAWRLLARPADAAADPPDNVIARTAQAAGDALRQQFPTLVMSEAAVGLPHLAAVSWEQMSDAQLDMALDDMLLSRCRNKPLLVTLDEAHTLNLEVGRRLLNLSQQARRQDAPLLLVMAGTPDLKDHLGRMEATFWSRSKVLGIGRLTPTATAEALVQPLADMDIVFSPEALTAVVEDSQCYPYFIQVWGHALCRGLAKADEYQVASLQVQQAMSAVEAARTHYYGERYREMKTRRLQDAAAAVGALFNEQPAPLTDAALLEKLILTTGIAEELAEAQLNELVRLGYIWHPAGDDRCEPGIPSLMKYVLVKTGPVL